MDYITVDKKVLRYNDWFKRMCEYGFIENVDYIAITQKRVTAVVIEWIGVP